MLEITNTCVTGFEAAVRGMRNPKNSWNKSDSYFGEVTCVIGQDDLALMKRLVLAGPDHGKFMRFIQVSFDANSPLYWLKELDTYKVGTTSDSCSTMHKIHSKQFTRADFSCEHLTPFSLGVLDDTIEALNTYRDIYNDSNQKEDWWQMIQLLPSSYNQLRTFQMNYAVLRNIYHARKNHKLDEWHTFCDWIESLPYAELITLEAVKGE